MKRYLFIILLVFIIENPLYASKPLLGIIGFDSKTPGISNASNILERHVIDIVNSTGIFDVINTSLLKHELNKFKCLDEGCILRFAMEAGLHMIIRWHIEDCGEDLIIELKSYGICAPYFGRIIYKYRIMIPLSLSGISTRLSHILEEHVSHFFSRLLQKYTAQIFIKREKNGVLALDVHEFITGAFTLYRYDNAAIKEDPLGIFKPIGKLWVKENIVVKRELNAEAISSRDFILISYNNQSRFLKDFYYGRKKEIVFEESSGADTFLEILFTPIASALMPVIAPIGYYTYGDFRGLSLWIANTLPYLYIEYYGLANRPEDFRDDKRNISKNTLACNRFAIYMLFCGGISLVADLFSHRHLALSSDYYGRHPYMGNKLSAAYLSLVSGGGGHFYRGYRSWGYLYFHLNNILLYFTIREFSRGERYDISTNSYNKEEINEEKGYTLLGLFGCVKIMEIIHVLYLKDNIRNRGILEECLNLEPEIYLDREMNININAKYTYRF
ncbi:MAG: hypothetical protein SVZ03_13230 [Spirochaetota bacterium]|nr:hypothetical protein [Spirochaetota bacterium]